MAVAELHGLVLGDLFADFQALLPQLVRQAVDAEGSVAVPSLELGQAFEQGSETSLRIFHQLLVLLGVFVQGVEIGHGRFSRRNS